MHFSTILACATLPFFTIAAPALQHTSRTLPDTTLFSRQTPETCDLSTLQQPPNTMTPPTSDLTLVLIALGRGTQNYTCASPTSTPSAIGAVATLFNASCAVASGSLGSIEEGAASIGAHFFVDNTTPEFDIIGLGNTQVKKTENMTAPDAGQDVPWLLLEAKEQGSSSAVRRIYRLNTEGGVAPTSCAGFGAGETVAVSYEAQYWVYASTEALNVLRRKRAMESR